MVTHATAQSFHPLHLWRSKLSETPRMRDGKKREKAKYGKHASQSGPGHAGRGERAHASQTCRATLTASVNNKSLLMPAKSCLY